MAFAMVAVSLRVLIPAGYMPGGPGEAAIILCTAQGVQTVYVGPDGQRAEQPDTPADGHSGKTSADHPCAFSGLAQAFSAEVAAAVAPALPVAAAPILGPTSRTAPGRGLAAPPPPSTGPPLTV